MTFLFSISFLPQKVSLLALFTFLAQVFLLPTETNLFYIATQDVCVYVYVYVYVCMLSCSVMSNSLRPHYSLPGSSVHGDSPGKNTGVGCHALLWGSSQPRNLTQVSHIADRFFTIWATREAQYI